MIPWGTASGRQLIREGGDPFLDDLDKLQSLCSQCHDDIHKLPAGDAAIYYRMFLE